MTQSGGASSARKVPRDVDHHHTLIAAEQERRLQHGRSLVVHQILIPAAFDEFGDDHRDLSVRVLRSQLRDVIQERGEEMSMKPFLR